MVCYKINYNEKLNLNNRTKQYLEGSATDKDYTMKLLGININYMNRGFKIEYPYTQKTNIEYNLLFPNKSNIVCIIWKKGRPKGGKNFGG